MLNFLADTAQTAEAPTGGILTMMLPLLVMFAIFYFIAIRPENKRKKEADAMRSSLKVGDEIITVGGVIGTVVNIKEDRIVIETSADQVRVEFTKSAIHTNETAAKAAAEAAKKAEEERAKAKAAKKAGKK